MGQHGLMGKQNSYEHSQRVPLVLAGPGIAAGARRQAFVYLLDLFPTLCDYLELPRPDSVEGESFAPLLTAPPTTGPGGRDAVYFAYDNLLRSLKDRQYKLIEYCHAGQRHTQLFDYRADPDELHDLSAEPALQPRLAALRTRLRDYATAWGDRQTPQGAAYWDAFG